MERNVLLTQFISIPKRLRLEHRSLLDFPVVPVMVQTHRRGVERQDFLWLCFEFAAHVPG